MNIRVKCVDARFTKRGDRILQLGKVYRIVGFSGIRRTVNFVKLKGFGEVEYLARRFKILDKEIVITLPDDFYKLPKI